MKIRSDYLLHKWPNKRDVYKDNSLWWSSELHRWMCSNPQLIERILKSQDFIVHDYKIDSLAAKFNIDLCYIRKLLPYFPLAINDDSHKVTKKRFANEISKNSDLAINLFARLIERNITTITANESIDLVGDVLLPPLKSFILATAGLNDYGSSVEFDSLTQILDDGLSLKRRFELNNDILRILNLLPESMPEDEKYFRISILALGSDSLIGTITESIVCILSANIGRLCCDIEWDSAFPATGVPVIERISTREFRVEDKVIAQNQRVRLYLDAAGYDQSIMPSYSQLYFGSGAHACPGMHIGRNIWEILISNFKKVHKKLDIKTLEYRSPDNIFNIYNKILVNVHD